MTGTDPPLHHAASAHLLTPHAPGAPLLVRALWQQHALWASPRAKAPLSSAAQSPQRIYCESSGSTGAPKLIRRSPASWQASFEINQQHFGIRPSDRYAILGHLGHSLSLYGALEAPHLGADLALLSDLGPRQQAAALRDHQISTLYATPSQLEMLLRADTGLFPDVTRILFGGGRPDPSFRQRLSRHFPAARQTEFFGASETSFISISDAQTPPGSVGRAYPGVSLRIGDNLPPGEIGEIWVQSPYLFEGYERGDSPLTRWQNGFLSIAELGRVDENGYLYLMGRSARMVTVADHNVYPEAIEALLQAQPGIQSAAVITPRDPQRGAIVVAAIVPDPETTPDEPALRRTCRAELGNAAVPRLFWHLPELPMLAAGKPDLQQLETLWQERTP